MKKLIIIGIAFAGFLAGCTTSQPTENTLSVMSGDVIDFNKIINDEVGHNSKATKIEITDPSTKDNIEDEMKSENTYVVFRKNGRITSFNIKDGTLKISQSDGEDTAIVKVSYRNDLTAKNDFEKTYTINYDCDCD